MKLASSELLPLPPESPPELPPLWLPLSIESVLKERLILNVEGALVMVPIYLNPIGKFLLVSCSMTSFWKKRNYLCLKMKFLNLGLFQIKKLKIAINTPQVIAIKQAIDMKSMNLGSSSFPDKIFSIDWLLTSWI